MPVITYLVLLASCAMYGVALLLGYYNTNPDSGWHTLLAILFTFDAACAALCLLFLLVVIFRGMQKKAHAGNRSG
jgi:hypothetical protein